ncbi:DUF4280 domain-containing protein [Pyxidicoccus xibeiensis]|uniref:DUF4280 domain-containing protein n=1 Tax=Pyxidicoccus xibeiensis TaxID=2906759 RepID=UPI0020A71B10|nr:DUF4280 domain-containing protein [Pyxidicoccus xibeiensis]MCP3137405.1 DUF4280 domain-containing protein [Pyxidicoccus xibeiensis]
MPGFLLHMGATVMCAHAGQAQPAVTNPRVRVSGQPTVVQSNMYTVSACPFTTPGGPMPCITAQWTVAATRVRSGGQPLLLQDSQAICTPNGTPLMVTVTQVRARGM